MKTSLDNHPIWDEFDKALVYIDMENIVMRHLESCHYKVNGYWSEDKFYEEIALISPIRAELVSASIGETQIKHPIHKHRWIRLQFLLKHDISVSQEGQMGDDAEIGELVLILTPNLNIIDENWFIDVESPFVIAKRGNISSCER